MIKFYSVEQILPLIKNSRRRRKTSKIEIDGYVVSNDTISLYTFKRFGTNCNKCKLKGTFFVIEKQRPGPGYCLHLYGILKGKPVLMTCDHILAQSLGGSKHALSNLQTLCENCNFNKSLIEQEEIKNVI